jgi:hypothetical protein
MNKVIDLSQPEGFGDTPITIDKITRSDAQTERLPTEVLTELNFEGNVLKRGCILTKDALKIPADTTYDAFKMGMFYLPKDFRYVNCQFDALNQSMSINNCGTKRDEDIKTPIVLNLKSYTQTGDGEMEKAPLIAHHCENVQSDSAERTLRRADRDYVAFRPDTIREGCLACTRSLYEATDFILFCYEGQISLPENQDPIEGEFYLIPLNLSCGTPVYYVIRSKVNGFDYDYANTLSAFYKQLLQTPANFPNAKYADAIVAKAPIRYDDHLMVLLVSSIAFEDLG